MNKTAFNSQNNLQISHFETHIFQLLSILFRSSGELLAIYQESLSLNEQQLTIIKVALYVLPKNRRLGDIIFHAIMYLLNVFSELVKADFLDRFFIY